MLIFVAVDTSDAQGCVHARCVTGRPTYMKAESFISRVYVWLEIVLLGTAVALASALLLATMGAAAAFAYSQAARSHGATQPQSFEGMITCSRCEARHQPALDRSASNCVRICVRGGASFALIDHESIYLLDGDLNPLKRLAGQRARVVGIRTGNTIKVSSIAAAT